ncbi:hypothetical protein [Caballeronia sp. LZ016]|uniref:hypothetical protein n=1 Tax=Caballeronia sp. LZ016 TaxID=3038554 RepID=UPI002854ADDA|nr:hypothetical protein [Caballeronia sp. LZ016]MDR5737695.1 hypothetical protein [Caballeronia sp. LZ016]
MAARMWVATTMDGREVSAETIGSLQEPPPLRCVYCRAPVSFVPHHARESRGKAYSVKAYFRLFPKVAHNEDCVFNVEEQLKVIARRSFGLLQAIEQGQYRFRLLAIADIRDIDTHLKRSKISRKADIAGDDSAFLSSDSRCFLSAYINAAKRVIELRSLCASNSGVRDRLEFVFNGMSVNWEDFYYEEARFLAAYRWLGMTATSFPVTLVGTVANIETIERRGRTLYVLHMKSSAAHSYSRDPMVGEVAHATVWTNQAEWLHSLKGNDTVLVFGHWRHATVNTVTTFARKGDSKFRKFLERQLSIWLHVKSQISRVIASG